MPQAAVAFAVWVGNAVAGATVGAAISTASIVVASTVTAAVIVGEVYALNELSKALTPKIQDPGTAITWQSDPRGGCPYGVGYGPIGGNNVFAQSCGENAKYLNFTTVYSGAGPIQGIDYFAANDVPISFSADSGEGASGYYLNRMWLKTQLGTNNEPALVWTAVGSKDTPANHGGNPFEWTANHKLSTYAATKWCLEYDPKKYQSGVPSPSLYAWWVKVYDPRKDDTYPGGVGPQRWNNEATWAWSDNPYLHDLTWRIGRHANGVLTFGMGADLEDIDVAAFVHGANVCDANGWKANGVARSDEDKYEISKAFLQAGGGMPMLAGALMSCFVNAPSTAVAEVTGQDILQAMTVPAQVSMLDRINTVWPTYIDPALGYQQVTPDVAIQVPEYLPVDQGERSIELTYRMVYGGTQAGQLARYAIEDARELSGIVFTAKPALMWVEPGNCVTINYPESGFNGQKVRVLKRTLDLQTKLITFYCRTETDGKHAYALGQTTTPPPDPRLTAVDTNVVAPPTIGDWGIIAGYVAGPGGQLPAIIISGLSNNYDAVQIVVEYREILAGGGFGEWQSQTFPGSAKELVVTGVKPGAHYEVKIRYVTTGGVETPTDSTNLGEIIVGGVDALTINGDPVPDLGQIQADILQLQIEVDQAQADADAALDYLLDPVNGALIEIDQLQQGAASVTSQIAALQTADQVIAGRVTTVEAKSADVPNLVKNSDASDPEALKYWLVLGPGRFISSYDPALGWRFVANTDPLEAYIYQKIAALPGAQLTLSLSGGTGGVPGPVGLLYAEWRDAADANLGQAGQVALTADAYDWALKRATFTTNIAPAGTAGLRVYVRANAGAPTFGFSRFMVSSGTLAAGWNDAFTASNTLARVRQSEVAITNDTQALASYKLEVSASFATTNANVTSESIARANADAALSARIDTVSAGYTVQPNLLLNSDASDPTALRYWTQNPPGFATPGYGNQVGSYFSTAATGVARTLTQDIPLAAGNIVSLSFAVGPVTGTAPSLYAQFLDAGGVPIGPTISTVIVNPATPYSTLTKLENMVAPAGTVSLRVGYSAAAGTPALNFVRFMLNYGPIALPWNDARVASNTLARVQTEEATRASADTALATRTTTVEASIIRTPNLLLNSDFSDPDPWKNWSRSDLSRTSAGYDAQVGSVAWIGTGPTDVFVHQTIAFVPGGTLSLGVYGSAPVAPGAALKPGIYVDWLDAGGTPISSANLVRFDTSNLNWVYQGKYEGLVSPAGTAQARIVLWSPANLGQTFSFSRIMASYGSRTVIWDNARQASATNARVKTEEDARAAADSALATRTTTVEASLRVGAPNLLVNSDFSDGMRFWTTGGVAGQGYACYVNNYLGPILTVTPSVVNAYFLQDNPASVGVQYTLSAEGDGGAYGGLYLQMLNAAKDTVLATAPRISLASWDSRASTSVVAPAGTAYARVLCPTEVGGTPYSLTRLMLQRGAATAWSNQTAQGNTAARVSTVEVANATQDSSIATLTTNVGASLQQSSSIPKNAFFGAYTTSPGIPDGWSLWSGAATRFTRVSGQGANYAVRGSPGANEDLGIFQTIYLVPGKYNVRLEGWCSAGDWAGAGCYIDGYSAINCVGDPDNNGVVANTGPGIRRWGRVVTITAAGNVNIYCMHSWSGFATTRAAKTVDFYCCAIEPLDGGGAQGVTANASVQVQAGAIATLQGKTSAWWSAQVEAGTGYAFIRAEADSAGGGGVRMAADEIALYNRSGGNYKVAMYVSGGNVVFTGNVRIDGNLTIAGTINTVAVAGNAISASVASGGNHGGVVGNNGTVGGALVAQVTIACTGGPVLVQGQYSFVCSAGPGNLNSTADLRRDGGTIMESGCYTVRGYKQAMTFAWLDTPAAGNHTYSIYDTVGPGATIAFYAFTVSATELKR